MSSVSTLPLRDAMEAGLLTEAGEIAQWQLVRIENTSRSCTYEYCLALEDAAMVDRALHDHAASAKKLEQAIATLNNLTPSTDEHRTVLARLLCKLAAMYLALRQESDAEAMLSQALTLARSNPDPETGVVPMVLLHMADWYARKKDYAGAFRHLLESLQHSRPRRSGRRDLYCDGLARLSQVYAKFGRLGHAEKVIRRAISWHLEYSIPESIVYAQMLSILGRILLKRGDRQGAESLRHEALGIICRLRPADHVLVNQVERYFQEESEKGAGLNGTADSAL